MKKLFYLKNRKIRKARRGGVGVKGQERPLGGQGRGRGKRGVGELPHSVKIPAGEVGRWGLGDVPLLAYQCEGSLWGSFRAISKNVALQGFSESDLCSLVVCGRVPG